MFIYTNIFLYYVWEFFQTVHPATQVQTSLQIWATSYSDDHDNGSYPLLHPRESYHEIADFRPIHIPELHPAYPGISGADGPNELQHERLLRHPLHHL